MSQAVGALDITFVCGATTLADKQYKFVTLHTDGTLILGGTGGVLIGILQNTPAIGQAARVRVLGTSKLVMSTTCSVLAQLKSVAGAGITVTTAKDWVGAIALEAATTANDIIEVLVVHTICTA
ncbi:MAG: hypothetical protein Q7J40_02970 [Atribacterota bacterium]|nr:hypothetical protein [Atribacterota bacterium]